MQAAKQNKRGSRAMEQAEVELVVEPDGVEESKGGHPDDDADPDPSSFGSLAAQAQKENERGGNGSNRSNGFGGLFRASRLGAPSSPAPPPGPPSVPANAEKGSVQMQRPSKKSGSGR